MTWLTKTRFMSGRQCHKRLWLEIHEPIESAPDEKLTVINGRAVDRVAQSLNPGVVISRDQGLSEAIAKTATLMNSATAATLHQPAFRAGDLAVIADVVRPVGKTFQLIEVKSSTSVKKKEHIPDAAFQTLVMRTAGIPVAAVSIGNVDKSFVLKTVGDYRGLITETDITVDVDAMLPSITDEAAELTDVMAVAKVPAVPMGEHCNTPYECPYKQRCGLEQGPRPTFSVDLLPRGGKVVVGLRADGYEDLVMVPPERLTSEKHRRVHRASATGVPFFDAAATAGLRTKTYPMAYLDFETIAMAVPELVGTRPYQQVPFQWSLHVEESSASLRHAEYLAIEAFGDFGALARALLAELPAVGPIFAYNKSFERGRLLELAGALPEHAEALQAAAERLEDLWPITHDAYYHRDMQGSWSIKDVVPTMSAALDYRNLGVVQEGEGAQLAFLELRGTSITPERRQALTKDLLSYCQRDTWATVVLRRFLCGEALGI